MPWPSLEWPIRGLMPSGPTGQVAMGSSQKVTWIQTPVQQETLRDETWGLCVVGWSGATFTVGVVASSLAGGWCHFYVQTALRASHPVAFLHLTWV
jgi:hypothetical protein